jgi:hypothetical protein
MRDDLGSRALIRDPGAFLVRTQLVEVHYRWRPNLPDEGDNHALELAVAGGDAPIVTFNRRDFRGGRAIVAASRPNSDGR